MAIAGFGLRGRPLNNALTYSRTVRSARAAGLRAIAICAALAVLVVAANRAGAFDPRAARARQMHDLPPSLQQSLSDTLSDAAEPYLDAEENKKSKNQPYVDLQPKFEYLPQKGPSGNLMVSAKLGGAEYDPSKPSTSPKGAATGKLKYLVFSYQLVNNKKWAEVGKPKWESQDLGAAAGKKMTAAAERADKRRAAQAARAAQLKAAADQAQKAADKSGSP